MIKLKIIIEICREENRKKGILSITIPKKPYITKHLKSKNFKLQSIYHKPCHLPNFTKIW